MTAVLEAPVEVIAPDIEPYRSHGAFPWVTTMVAAADGPHVAVTAVVHGNEPCGAVALDWLFRHNIRPRRGRLSLAFLNVEAYRRFDPRRPANARWVDEDLNRVWDAATLEGERVSCELRRARELRPWVDSVDLLLDLHSMQQTTAPLILAGLHEKGARLAAAVASPSLIVADPGHAAGRRLRDYGGFGREDARQAAILVECGQHWSLRAAEVAVATSVRFLRATGVVDPDWEADAVGSEPAAEPPRRIEVTEAVTIRTHAFRFIQPFVGLEIIPTMGTLIAEDDDRPIRTPYDRCVLIMPSRRLVPGQTAVRLGRFVD